MERLEPIESNAKSNLTKSRFIFPLFFLSNEHPFHRLGG